jgi:hypothetical protein
LPDPREALNKAALEVRNAKSLKIKLQLSGATSYVDPPTNSIAFVSADGGYAAPDRVKARVVAKILGIAGEVEVVAIGDDQWYSNKILTAGQFVKAVFAPGFNAAKLVSSDAGIESALKAIRDLKTVGAESLYGVDVYHIAGTADGKDIEALTVGLIRGKLVNVDIYVNRQTFRVERVIIVQPDTVTDKEPKPTTWNLEIFDYNGAIAIDPPAGAIAGSGRPGLTIPGAATAAPTVSPADAPTSVPAQPVTPAVGGSS